MVSATNLEGESLEGERNLKPWITSVFSADGLSRDSGNASDLVNDLKGGLKSDQVADKERGNAFSDFKLKAIDLELANSLCLSEIKLARERVSVDHSDTSLKVYTYLVIKLSQALSRGEVCIEFSQLYDLKQKTGILFSELKGYLAQFTTTHNVELSRNKREALAQLNPYDLVINYPLVSMQERLYFSRYWFYQQQVFFSISSRLSFVESGDAELSQVLQGLFPQKPFTGSQEKNIESKAMEPDWQMLAAANACLNRFSVITGGPGTGKTTTVTRLLAALISQQPNLRVALAAPTGKAAARLVESILAAKTKLAESFPLADKIPVKSFTLHRLLGWRPSGFSYDHKKTLPYDLVIIDEASMVDLPMMAQLMEALGKNTRLILLGDKDQLASVEAGSVLGDLCDSGVLVNGYHAHGLEENRAQELETLCGFQAGFLTQYIEPNAPLMANSLTQLRVSHRFTSDSGIGKLAAAVNAGQFEKVQQSFQKYSDIHSYTAIPRPFTKDLLPIDIESEQAWQRQVIKGYSHYLKAIEAGESPYQVLQLFNEFQLLCGVRQGNSGLHALNERVQKLLQGRGLLNIDQGETNNNASSQNRWYVGRPVMISQNDYELNLFNGDIGIAMMVASGRASGEDKELRVCFMTDVVAGSTENSKVRQLLPTRLPAHETAFAMTVHKSQGSEFSDVALVLPETHSPVISRELIYTAITRGKQRFSLYSNEDVLAAGIQSKVVRASGLRDLLFIDS